MPKEKTLIQKIVSESNSFAPNHVAHKAVELVFEKIEKESLDIDNGTYKRLWSQSGLQKLKEECLK